MALESPDEFPFPFQPYGIQKEFMRQLYLTLERGAIGIFESPTGTVNLLKIMCDYLCLFPTLQGQVFEFDMRCSEVAGGQ